jgi:peptidoglycan/xylan/chitin deacetylase (PgdA/CDA1 family)
LRLLARGASIAISLKALAAKSLHGAAYSFGLSLLLTQLRPAMRIVMFHGVGGYHYSGTTFRAQMTWLRQHLRVVSLEAMITRMDEAGAELRRDTALTFDDGLRNNFTVAYPILKELGLPATFFVCPGLIDSRTWLWNHEARQRLLRLDEARLLELSARLGCGPSSVEGVVDWMKSLPLERRRAAEDHVRMATQDFNPTEDERRHFDPMRWDDILALDPSVITIGSHTRTHPILTTLDADQLQDEVVQSRVQLEGRLGRAVRLFCYPNGDADLRVMEPVKRTYEAAVTTRSGLLRCGEDRYALPRIPTGPNMHLFTWRMHRPTA